MHEEDNLFLTSNVPEASLQDVWFVDSACSNHMTGNKKAFVEMESFQSEVRTGDNNKLQVKGKGDILVETKQGMKRISNVFYVPDLKHNLLSVNNFFRRGMS